MMDIYLFPIRMAIFTFLALSTLLTTPYLIFQYRKYGSISWYRTLILFSFFLYLLCAYYLVVLPLPDPETLEPMTNLRQHINLNPLRAYSVFLTNTSLVLSQPRTYLTALTEMVFLEPFFNVLLTVPFGFYLGYYFKLSFKKTILFSFLLTVFFELTQLSALYGFYPRPYRYADINDIMHNTLGGMIGFWIYKRFSHLLPSRESIDLKNIKKSEHVTYGRRFFAFMIDYYIVSILNRLLTHRIIDHEADSQLAVFTLHIVLLGYFIIAQLFFKKTIGQKVVHTKIISDHQSFSYTFSIIIRNLLFMMIMFIISYLNYLVYNRVYNGLYAVLLLCLVLLIGVDAWRYLRKKQSLWYERISKTRHINTKKI